MPPSNSGRVLAVRLQPLTKVKAANLRQAKHLEPNLTLVPAPSSLQDGTSLCPHPIPCRQLAQSWLSTEERGDAHSAGPLRGTRRLFQTEIFFPSADTVRITRGSLSSGIARYLTMPVQLHLY